MSEPKKWNGDRGKAVLGVDGSLHRRILELCEQCGLVLVDVRDIGHPSRMTLVFDDETHLTEVTIEAKELEPKPALKLWLMIYTGKKKWNYDAMRVVRAVDEVEVRAHLSLGEPNSWTIEELKQDGDNGLICGAWVGDAG